MVLRQLQLLSVMVAQQLAQPPELASGCRGCFMDDGLQPYWCKRLFDILTVVPSRGSGVQLLSISELQKLVCLLIDAACQGRSR